MKIALATPPIPHSLNEGLVSLRELVADAAAAGAQIVCFPESFLPGYPGMGYSETDRSAGALEPALQAARELARRHSIALILPMDWHCAAGLQNVAFVISADGAVLGHQAKVQLDPSEDELWVPGERREMFQMGELRFGISICHEGFRYPETVRWAARNGATIVFHPHFSGGEVPGVQLTEWGHVDNPYYEKAMMMRSIENGIYFASVNYASTYTESATTVINPDGSRLAWQPYGKPGILVVDIDPEKATAHLAKRFRGTETIGQEISHRTHN